MSSRREGSLVNGADLRWYSPDRDGIGDLVTELVKCLESKGMATANVEGNFRRSYQDAIQRPRFHYDRSRSRDVTEVRLKERLYRFRVFARYGTCHEPATRVYGTFIRSN